jgi:transposase
MLLVAKGLSFSEICRRLNCTDRYISVWKRRFEQERLKGLDSRYRGSQRRVRTAQLEAKTLETTRKGPSDGTTHWSSYRLAKHLGVSHTTVYRVWRQFGIQPHRLRRYMASDDPQFEEKAADVIGLYLNPPEHAAVFAVDEKSAIQALDRLDPVLPLSPGRAERQPKEKEIHVIADNLSAHKTKEVSAFLLANPKVRIHYTPTYSSWLNQVEIWFSKIQRQIIARGVVSSVEDLARKIMRFIRNYNKTATPIRWRYADEKQRISSAI